MPPEARRQNLQNQAARADIAPLVDDAILAVERDNPNLKGKLPRDYARRGIAPEKMKGLIDLIANIGFKGARAKARDTLGRVYEYFLGKFAQAEGKLGGKFFTPRCIVRLLVEMLEPYDGRVYDPCCGSAGMFVQSQRFVDSHGGQTTDISIFGQESNPTTWRLAHMNLAIRGIEANLGPQPADSFLRDLHPDLKADYILANPPFNVSDWSGQLLQDDVRWRYGTPPKGNANYAWIQHFLHHIAPPNGHGGGMADFVMANGSLSSASGGEGDIRQKIVEADLVDCIVALPAQLFLTTGIPACPWFLRRLSWPPRPRAHRGASSDTSHRATQQGTLQTWQARRRAASRKHYVNRTNRLMAYRADHNLHVVPKAYKALHQLCFTHPPKLPTKHRRQLGLGQAQDHGRLALRQTAFLDDLTDFLYQARLDLHSACIGNAKIGVDVTAGFFNTDHVIYSFCASSAATFSRARIRSKRLGMIYHELYLYRYQRTRPICGVAPACSMLLRALQGFPRGA